MQSLEHAFIPIKQLEKRFEYYFFSQPISHEQNITVRIDDSTTGSYLCHAETPGYSHVTSNTAEVLMTGRPKITSSQRQTGVEGENVHINCAAIAIPKYKSISWTYHGSALDDSKRKSYYS